MTDALYCYPLELLCQPLSWWSSAASWAQALLSAGAIYAAYKIAAHQRASEQRQKQLDDENAARSFALVVLREMKTLRDRLETSRASVPNPFGENEGRNVAVADIPQSLWNNAPQMHLLGDASAPVIQCMYQLQESRGYLKDRLLWGDEKVPYLAHLEAAIKLADEAILKLRKLLD